MSFWERIGCLLTFLTVVIAVILSSIGKYEFLIFPWFLVIAVVIYIYFFLERRRKLEEERIDKEREEEAIRLIQEKEREAARLAKERNEIINLVHQTQNIIEKAISNATDRGDSLWLSALLILREDSDFLRQGFENGRLSYSNSKAKLSDLKEKAEVLSSPPPKEEKEGDTPGEPDYYQVLQIGRDASLEQIKAIYRKLAFIYHPDTSKSFGVDSDQPFRQIKEAYETLSDPIKRREYDKKIGA